MGTNESSQPPSKSSWDSQDFGDVKMAHFHKSIRPQWVNGNGFTQNYIKEAVELRTEDIFIQ